MANFAKHIRVTALGSLGSGQEEKFSYGLSLAMGAGSNDFNWFTGGAKQSDLVDIAEDIRAFHARATSLISPLAVLEAVKFAVIGEDGTYIGNAREINVANTPGGSDQPLAVRRSALPQSSLCVSLGTGSRLASKRGRFYPPMTTIEVENDLHVAAGAAEVLRDSARQLIQDINNEPGFDDVGGVEVVIASGTKATNTPVTEVRVGRLVDTIRSRRRQMQEAYTSPVSV